MYMYLNILGTFKLGEQCIPSQIWIVVDADCKEEIKFASMKNDLMQPLTPPWSWSEPVRYISFTFPPESIPHLSNITRMRNVLLHSEFCNISCRESVLWMALGWSQKHSASMPESAWPSLSLQVRSVHTFQSIQSNTTLLMYNSPTSIFWISSCDSCRKHDITQFGAVAQPLETLVIVKMYGAEEVGFAADPDGSCTCYLNFNYEVRFMYTD